VLTATQAKYVEMDKKYLEYKEFLEEFEKAKSEVAAEVGLLGSFQDAEGIVYQVVLPQWKNVRMEHVGVLRTKREGERAGTLSVTKAKELGYAV